VQISSAQISDVRSIHSSSFNGAYRFLWTVEVIQTGMKFSAVMEPKHSSVLHRSPPCDPILSQMSIPPVYN